MGGWGASRDGGWLYIGLHGAQDVGVGGGFAARGGLAGH